MLPLSEEQLQEHEAATHCCFCGQGFDVLIQHPGNKVWIDSREAGDIGHAPNGIADAAGDIEQQLRESR